MKLAPWDPLETQDEYDVALALTEDAIQLKVRRNRIQTFNDWARARGITHPAEVSWSVWVEFIVWLEHDVGYQHVYRVHVMDAVIRWLEWAHEQGYREEVSLGELLDLQAVIDTCQAHKLNQLSFPANETDPHNFHMRELMLGLVFGEGYAPERLHLLKVTDYDHRAHTLLSRRLDPRTELLMQRYIGFRIRRGRNIKQLLVKSNGSPLGPRAVRHRINAMVNQIKPFENPLRLPTWMPYPDRDREPVLTALMQRPRPATPRRAMATPADMVIKRLTRSIAEPAWRD